MDPFAAVLVNYLSCWITNCLCVSWPKPVQLLSTSKSSPGWPASDLDGIPQGPLTKGLLQEPARPLSVSPQGLGFLQNRGHREDALGTWWLTPERLEAEAPRTVKSHSHPCHSIGQAFHPYVPLVKAVPRSAQIQVGGGTEYTS